MTLGVVLVCSSLLATPGPGAGPLTVEQMSADLDQLAQIVRAEWSYYQDRREHNGLDLDAVLAGSRCALAGVRTPEAFAGVLEAFVAALQDGHAYVSVPNAARADRHWPLHAEECEEGVVVLSVVAEPGSEARWPAPGDVLVSVDGRPVSEAIADAERRVFASTAGARRLGAVERLHRTPGASVALECRTPAGEVYRTALPTLDRQLPGRAKAPAENWSLSWPAEGVACLRISSFAVADWQGWLRAAVADRDRFVRDTYALIDERFEEVRSGGARGLILDLRGNGGGTDLLGMHVAEHLFAEPFVYMRLSGRFAGRWGKPTGETSTPVDAPYTGPVVALVDAGCFSTTDNFLRCLDDLHPEFTAVGRPSGGGTGAPREMPPLAHSGAVVTLCTMRVYGPKSDLIEGRGTAPDIAVRWTREDHLSGRDPDLAAALAYLAKRRP